MWDWILSKLPAWLLRVLPDLSPRETYEVVRDASSLGIAVLGAYLAYLAIRLGRQQATIAERQTEIAEKQDRLIQMQLAKRADLKIEMPMMGVSADDGFSKFKIYVSNSGTKTARDLHWDIYVPVAYQNLCSTASSLISRVEEMNVDIAGSSSRPFVVHARESTESSARFAPSVA